MPEITYQLLRPVQRSRSITINIKPEGEVIVRAPRWIPQSEVDRFVRSKATWITKHLQKIASRPQSLPKQFVHGEPHLYFGEEYPLYIVGDNTTTRPKVEFIYNRFELHLPTALSSLTKQKLAAKAMLKWYLDNGQRIITQKVDYYTQKLGVSYQKITLKKVSSIWGSCSRSNNLNFNRKLIMAPHKIVDYVVIHEVCHLVHRNHSQKFWDLVAILDPDYKIHRKWLSDHSRLLYI